MGTVYVTVTSSPAFTDVAETLRLGSAARTVAGNSERSKAKESIQLRRLFFINYSSLSWKIR